MTDSDILCPECRKNIHIVQKSYRISGHKVHVLYEYNEFMEQLLFQYKEDRDIALGCLFLHGHSRLIRKLRKRKLAALASWPEKVLVRGFDSLAEIFLPWGLELLHPWEKTAGFKQSENDPGQRREVKHLIRPVQPAPVLQDTRDRRKLLIVDDVVTTGSTLEALLALADDPRAEAFVLAAHPLWLQSHKKDRCLHAGFFR